MGFHIPTDALIVVWSVVIATVLLMAFFTKLYRKAGPNEALVVYGIRGPRIIKGHGTIITPDKVSRSRWKQWRRSRSSPILNRS